MKTKTSRELHHTYCEDKLSGTYNPPANGTRSTEVFAYANYVSNHGDNLPDWKDRLATGRDASTYMDGTLTYCVTTLGVAVRQGLVFDTRNEQKGALTHLRAKAYIENPGVIGTSTVNQATTKAAIAYSKNYRNRTRNWQGGVFFAEMAETVALLANPVKGLRVGVTQLYKDLKRLFKQELYGKKGIPPALLSERRAKLLAEQWLIWQFGVQPLISDANDAAEALRAMASGRNFEIVRIRGDGAHEARVDSMCGDIALAPVAGRGSYCYTNIEVVDRTEVTYHGAWKNAAVSGEMPLPMRFGLSLSDIVPTLYEATLYSFLLDYFSNMGDVLDAWCVGMVDFAWLNRTTRSRRIVRMSDVRSTPLEGESRYAYGGNTRVVTKTVKREKVQNFNDAKVLVKLPGVGSTQWLNIAALAEMARKL